MCPPDVIFHISSKIQSEWGSQEIEALIHKISEIEHMFSQSNQSSTSYIREKCVFLDESNQCRIYDLRPISCRSFTSGNVDTCESLFKGKLAEEEGVDQNQFRFFLHQAATTGLMQANKEKGRSSDQVFLLPAVKAALQDPQLEKKWHDGTLIW